MQIWYEYKGNFHRMSIKVFESKNVIQALRLSFAKKHKEPVAAYFEAVGYEVKKCAFCTHDARVSAEFSLIAGSRNKQILKVESVGYEKDLLFCKTNIACPGKRLNPNSVDFVSKTRSLTPKEALVFIHERNNTVFYSNNHESQEVYIKSQTRDSDFFNTLDEYATYRGKLKNCHSLATYQDRYGFVLGAEMHAAIQAKKDSMSFQYQLKKFAGDKEAAGIAYAKRLKQALNFGGGASHAANNFFEHLLFTLEQEHNSVQPAVYAGKDGYEFCLRRTNGRFFYYDLLLPALGIIIEYNCLRWHVEPSIMSTEQWQTYQHIFTKETADEVYAKELEKESLAKQNGYKLVKVWYEHTEEQNTKKAIDFIEQHGT